MSVVDLDLAHSDDRGVGRRIDELSRYIQEMRGELRSELSSRVLAAVYTVEVGDLRRRVESLEVGLVAEHNARVSASRSGLTTVLQILALLMSAGALLVAVLVATGGK